MFVNHIYTTPHRTHVGKQARQISPRRRNHHWPCRWDWMDWQKGHQRKPHWRPECQLDELRQVHSRHGWQHRPEEIPGGPENPPRQLVSARLPNPGVRKPLSL